MSCIPLCKHPTVQKTVTNSSNSTSTNPVTIEHFYQNDELSLDGNKTKNSINSFFLKGQFTEKERFSCKVRKISINYGNIFNEIQNLSLNNEQENIPILIENLKKIADDSKNLESDLIVNIYNAIILLFIFSSKKNSSSSGTKPWSNQQTANSIHTSVYSSNFSQGLNLEHLNTFLMNNSFASSFKFEENNIELYAKIKHGVVEFKGSYFLGFFLIFIENFVNVFSLSDPNKISLFKSILYFEETCKNKQIDSNKINLLCTESLDDYQDDELEKEIETFSENQEPYINKIYEFLIENTTITNNLSLFILVVKKLSIDFNWSKLSKNGKRYSQLISELILRIEKYNGIRLILKIINCMKTSEENVIFDFLNTLSILLSHEAKKFILEELSHSINNFIFSKNNFNKKKSINSICKYIVQNKTNNTNTFYFNILETIMQKIFSVNNIIPTDRMPFETRKVLGFYKNKVEYNPFYLPQKISNLPETARAFGTGDTHGNTLRIIADLIKLGFIKHLPQNIYFELMHIIQSTELPFLLQDGFSYEKFISFKEILKEFIIVENQKTLYILFGDILSDRRSNDILTLALIHELREKGLNFVITLSNHDLSFILKYFTGKGDPIFKSNPNHPCDLSLDRMTNFIDELDFNIKQIVEAEVKIFVEESYLKNLFLFITVPESRLFICHSSVNESIFNLLLSRFAINPNHEGGNRKKITELEDEVNNMFQKFLKADLTKKYSTKENNDKYILCEEMIDVLSIFAGARVQEESRIKLPHPGVYFLAQGHDSLANIVNSPFFTTDSQVGKSKIELKGEADILVVL